MLSVITRTEQYSVLLQMTASPTAAYRTLIRSVRTGAPPPSWTGPPPPPPPFPLIATLRLVALGRVHPQYAVVMVRFRLQHLRGIAAPSAPPSHRSGQAFWTLQR